MVNSTTEWFQEVAVNNASITWGLYTIVLLVPFILTYRLRRDVSDSLITSGFTSLIVNSLLWATNIMSWDIAVTSLPILILGFVMKYVQER